jgi:Tol biopolymer transport system component
MYSDGTNRRLLSCGAQMSWSPDGKRIAFAYMPSGELGDITTYIYIINVDGTNTVKLTNNLGVTDNTPSWSPDGTSIAFSSNRDYLTSKFNSEIYLMDVYGNNQTRLTNTITSAGSPQWSPDGTTIAFVADGICLINKDGTNYRQIINDEAGICVYRLPQWSPDGKQLVITWISSDGNAIKKIFIINNDGTGLKTILSDSTAVVSDWSK